MKRYGEKELTQGTRIRYCSTHRIYDMSPRIIDEKHGNDIGYITEQLFHKLTKSGKIIKDFGDHWYAEYIVI